MNREEVENQLQPQEEVINEITANEESAPEEKVQKIREIQLQINQLNSIKKFKIPIHLALGHECIAVALNSVFRPGDNLLLPHRNIHYQLAFENDVNLIFIRL